MAGHFGPIEAKPGDPVVILSCEKTVMVNGKSPERSGYDQRRWQIERFSHPRLIYEFQHHRGKKAHDPVRRNDRSCAQSAIQNPPTTPTVCYVNHTNEQA